MSGITSDGVSMQWVAIGAQLVLGISAVASENRRSTSLQERKLFDRMDKMSGRNITALLGSIIVFFLYDVLFLRPTDRTALEAVLLIVLLSYLCCTILFPFGIVVKGSRVLYHLIALLFMSTWITRQVQDGHAFFQFAMLHSLYSNSINMNPFVNFFSSMISATIMVYFGWSDAYTGTHGIPLVAVIVVSNFLSAQMMRQGLRSEIEAGDKEHAVRQTLLATFSHELRTPLHGIMAMLQTMKGMILTATASDGQGLNMAAMRHDVNVASTSAHVLNHLVNSILDMSKFESNGLVFVEERFDLRRMLHGIAIT